MIAKAWSIMYSLGMPPHPTPQAGGGWYFDFPTAPNSVHYIVAAMSLAASVSVRQHLSDDDRRNACLQHRSRSRTGR
jgi:hypothetical protein